MEYKKNFESSAIAATQSIKEGEYWQNKLSGEWVKSYFSYDCKKKIEGVEERRWESIQFTLEESIFLPLMKLRNGSDHRMLMILVAGLVVLLRKYTRNKDILLGIPVDRQPMEGEFINRVLVLRNIIEDNMSFKEVLLQVKETVIEAIENQNYPIEAILDLIGVEKTGDEEAFPLFDIAVVIENIHDKSYIRHINMSMVFSFLRTEECVSGVLEFDASLYKRATIERILNHLMHLLKQTLTNVNCRVSDIDILSAEEKKQVLFDFNRNGMAFPTVKTIHRLFEEQVRKTPDKTALVDTDGICMISYGDLNRRSGCLSALLRTKGVGPDCIVGLMMERSIEMIIGILGILKAGGAYLPIDTYYPAERVQYMLKDSAVDVLLVERERQSKLDLNTGRDVNIKAIIDPTDEELYGLDGSPSLDADQSDPDNLLYVIYTSGSTGKPKGVLVGHRGLFNLIYFHRHVFGEDSNSRMSQVASPGFDAMAFEIWPCLTGGATLYFADDQTRIHSYKMKEWLIRNGITISYQPTILAEQLLNENWPMEGVALRALRAAGDKLTHYPESSYPFRLYNLYGPTEDSVWTTLTEVKAGTESGNQALPTIGKPIANHQVYIVSSNLELLTVGIPGELCIGGMGIAKGYLNRQELTNGRFVENPFVKGKKEKLYRSGDLARWLPDGDIEFLGRKDNQVKIRGYRVELGEIENQLQKYHLIKDAVVLVKENNENDKYLCAFLVANADVDVSALRQYLSEKLPGYMIPVFFVEVDKIPLTPNGKIDSKTLLEHNDVIDEIEYAEPRNETEEKLVRIWKNLLDTQRIGIKDNFFNIGGDSIKSVRLLSLINEEFNKKFQLTDIYENETIEKLAEKVQLIEDKEMVDSSDEYNESLERLEELKSKFMKEI